MKFSGNKNWVDTLPVITKNINDTSTVSLGYLCPSEIRDARDEPLVRAAQAKLAAKMTEKQRKR